MDSSDINVSKLMLDLKEMEIRLDTVTAQNLKLNEENTNLRNQLNHLIKDYNVVELQMRLHKMENDRDELNETLQIIRVRNNKNRNEYKDKRKRSAIVEDMNKSQILSVSDNHNETQPKTLTTTSTDEVIKLRRQLNVALQIINELEFELDDVEYLEAENQQLRSEVNSLKEESSRYGDDHTITPSLPRHLPRLHQLHDSFEDEVDVRHKEKDSDKIEEKNDTKKILQTERTLSSSDTEKLKLEIEKILKKNLERSQCLKN